MRPSLLAAAFGLLATLAFVAPAEAEEKPSSPPVRCLAFSPDSGLLAAATADQFTRGELVVWEVNTWKVRFRHSESVGFPRVAFSPDGKLLALSRFAPETKLFDVETGKVVRELEGHTDHARCVTFTADGKRIITGSYDRTIKIWNVSGGKELATLEGSPSPVYHVAVSPGGSLLASAAAKAHHVCLWDLQTRKKLHDLGEFRSLVPHVAFSPNGALLAVSSLWGQLTLFDVMTLQPRQRIGGIGGVYWAEFSPDHKWLAVVSYGAKVYVFPADTSPDPKTSKKIRDLLAKFKEDSYAVRERATEELAALGSLADDQLREALKSQDAEVRVRARMLLRRLSQPDSAVQLQGHQDELECVTFSPDGKLMASGDRRGEVKVWRVGSWKQIASLSIGAK